MKKSLVIVLLALAVAGVAIQPAHAQGPQIKDPAEYKAYMAAVQQSTPAAQAQAFESFLQTYPNTVAKELALMTLMAAYQQANDAPKMVNAAGRLLHDYPCNTRGLATLTFYYRSLVAQGGPEGPKNLDLALQNGQKGMSCLETQKPVPASDADAKLRNDLSAIFEGAVGISALQKKNFADARKYLRAAVQHATQPNINDIYPLAAADLEGAPLSPEGFWFVVKASQLAQGSGPQQILDYGRKWYKYYHGSEAGWSDLVKQAQASTDIMPAAGFVAKITHK